MQHRDRTLCLMVKAKPSGPGHFPQVEGFLCCEDTDSGSNVLGNHPRTSKCHPRLWGGEVAVPRLAMAWAGAPGRARGFS